MGRLIVIEGLDGVGKATQTALLEEKLKDSGASVKRVSFPDYASPASAPLKMYLGGQLGQKPADVGAYAASCFFAVDRYASYKTGWEEDYLGDTLIICDRYATSNFPFQLPKLKREEWDAFIAFENDFEYNKLMLPSPSLVIYLSMQPDFARKLMNKRYEGDKSKMDLHESDVSYQLECYEAAEYACEKLGWSKICCTEDGELRSVEEISREVYDTVAASGLV
ncbi:MAG: thymidylate kinase [Oscillospiraceae bacterium]|jgi:dTMP kinase|nr:thymidylate kinase [Oscillospiraceae bacterium]